jgi:hypothetical protein
MGHGSSSAILARHTRTLPIDHLAEGPFPHRLGATVFAQPHPSSSFRARDEFTAPTVLGRTAQASTALLNSHRNRIRRDAALSAGVDGYKGEVVGAADAQAIDNLTRGAHSPNRNGLPKSGRPGAIENSITRYVGESRSVRVQLWRVPHDSEGTGRHRGRRRRGSRCGCRCRRRCRRGRRSRDRRTR